MNPSDPNLNTGGDNATPTPGQSFSPNPAIPPAQPTVAASQPVQAPPADSAAPQAPGVSDTVQPLASAPAQGASPALASKKETLATVALVLAIVGTAIPFCSLAGVIVGFVALKKIKANHSTGRGRAIVAIILGFIFVILGIVMAGLIIMGFIKYPEAIKQALVAPQNTSNQMETKKSPESSPVDTTSQSAADEVLKKDIIKLIYVREVTLGRQGELAVLGVTLKPSEGNSVVEEWKINVAGTESTYKVFLTPTSDGGADVGVERL